MNPCEIQDPECLPDPDFKCYSCPECDPDWEDISGYTLEELYEPDTDPIFGDNDL
tara:strand:- start:2593 stop:2757 length:165 start_codon:yes stop_codon:yes gene_type:complete